MSGTAIGEAARALAARRQAKERYCAVCGRPFRSIGRGVYCGLTCKQRAYRQRRRQRQAGADGVGMGAPTRPVEHENEERTLTPDIVARLDRTRAAIMRGRRFADDSTDLLNQARDEWSAAR